MTPLPVSILTIAFEDVPFRSIAFLTETAAKEYAQSREAPAKSPSWVRRKNGELIAYCDPRSYTIAKATI